jgi:hypothetical protein
VHVPRDEEDDRDTSAWAHSWHDHTTIESAFSDTGYRVSLGMLREAIHELESARYAKRWRRLHEHGDA